MNLGLQTYSYQYRFRTIDYRLWIIYYRLRHRTIDIELLTEDYELCTNTNRFRTKDLRLYSQDSRLICIVLGLQTVRGTLKMQYQKQRGRLFQLFSEYATNRQVSDDCYSFMTGISSYSIQLTPVCLLHTRKRAKTIFPFVLNMAFSTSPLLSIVLTLYI